MKKKSTAVMMTVSIEKLWEIIVWCAFCRWKGSQTESLWLSDDFVVHTILKCEQAKPGQIYYWNKKNEKKKRFNKC